MVSWDNIPLTLHWLKTQSRLMGYQWTVKSCSPHGYWTFSCFFTLSWLLKYMVATKFNRPIDLQIQIAWMTALENIWSYIGGIEFETGWVDILAREYFQKLRRPHCRVSIIRYWTRLMTIVSRVVILTFNFMHSFDLSYLTFSMLTHFLRREPGSAFYFNVLKI